MEETKLGKRVFVRAHLDREGRDVVDRRDWPEGIQVHNVGFHAVLLGPGAGYGYRPAAPQPRSCRLGCVCTECGCGGRPPGRS